MKTKTIQAALFALLCAATGPAGARGLGAGSIFSRIDDQAKKVTEAYAAIHEGFYGVGHERTLLKAALDVRPDGTPNITLDRAAGTAQFTIRLSVDDYVYNAWKADAHRRIEAVGMSVQFSDFEDPEARVIGGKPYRFGANEEAAIRRWEKSDAPKRAELVVRVDFVNAHGAVAKRYELPIKAFKRLGFDTYPLPLHHLNRLRDLSGSRFQWGKVEDSYANFTLTGLTDDFLNAVADVRCTVIDDAILAIEREKALKEAAGPVCVDGICYPSVEAARAAGVSGFRLATSLEGAEPRADSLEVFVGGSDADLDGLPDAWEQKYGLDPRNCADANQDADGDMFTNLEEFQARTNPKDPNSYPDYLDFLTLAGDLRTEELPFLLTQETPLRNGCRLTFVAAKKNQKNQPVIGDTVVTRSGAKAEVGKEIVFKLERPKFVKGKMQDDKVNTGWRVKDYKKDEKLVDVPGFDGLKKIKSTSIAELERISDGRTISVQIHETKPVVVEEQVDLVWSRGDGKPFTVTKGSKFKLKNREYEVKKLAKVGNACKVTVIDLKTDKVRDIEASSLAR